LDKALREVIQSDAALAAMKSNPQAFAANRELTDAERDALVAFDVRALYQMGAHPFLLNVAAMRSWPPPEFMPRMQEYVRAVADLGHPDFTT